MADATRFPFGHIRHGGLADNRFVGEGFGVALFTAIRLGMELVAERRRRDTLQRECDLFRLESFMAAVAVCRYGKNTFAVVACAAGTPFFHFRHSHRFLLAGDDAAVMASFAGAACFGNVGGMAEYGAAQAFYDIGDVPGLAAMTAGTVFLCGDTECPHTAMAGTAGFGFLHFRHGVAFLVLQAVDRIVTHFAVILVLFQMQIMAENHRPGIFKSKGDVLVLGRAADGSRQK